MRVQTEEWRKFIPGVRMYKGKMTLFYNGEILWDSEYLIYNKEQQNSWEVIIILPGVEVIPDITFMDCNNVEVLIMADSVKRIKQGAFHTCSKLNFVKLSQNLEYIGKWGFCMCVSMTAIFIPPLCKKIDQYAFYECKKLIIFHVPRHTQLKGQVITRTALSEKYLSIQHRVIEKRKESNLWMNYIRVIARSTLGKVFSSFSQNRIVTTRGGGFNEWLQNINADDHLELHRICSSFDPLEDDIYAIMKGKGLHSLQEPNVIGMTPLDYLQANPFADIDQSKILKLYVLELMWERRFKSLN